MINFYWAHKSRILYEIILSHVRSGVCTIATNNEEEIIAVCLNEIIEPTKGIKLAAKKLAYNFSSLAPLFRFLDQDLVGVFFCI